MWNIWRLTFSLRVRACYIKNNIIVFLVCVTGVPISVSSASLYKRFRYFVFGVVDFTFDFLLSLD